MIYLHMGNPLVASLEKGVGGVVIQEKDVQV